MSEAIVCGREVDLPNLGYLQDVYNYVIRHLRMQGVRSDENGSCMYRSRSNELACAVGCLIPDDHYKDNMEESAATTRMVLKGVFRRDIGEQEHIRIEPLRRLLTALQTVHDQIGEFAHGSDELRFGPVDAHAATVVAECFGLDDLVLREDISQPEEEDDDGE